MLLNKPNQAPVLVKRLKKLNIIDIGSICNDPGQAIYCSGSMIIRLDRWSTALNGILVYPAHHLTIVCIKQGKT